MNHDDWKPHAPDLKQNFEQRQQEQTQANNAINSGIATQKELDLLERTRPKPELKYELTPNGAIERTVHQQTNVAQENRIAFIKERLGKVNGLARDDFNRNAEDYTKGFDVEMTR